MNKIRIIYMEDDKELGRVDLHEDHELTNLFVAKRMRRQGIASLLMGLGEAVAERLGYPRVFATVALENKPSQGVWVKGKYAKYLKYEKRLK